MVRTVTSGVKRMMQADLAPDYVAVPKAMSTPVLRKHLDTLSSKTASKKQRLAESEVSLAKATNKLYQDRAELCRDIKDEAAAVTRLHRQEARELEDLKRKLAQFEVDIRVRTANVFAD